MEFWGVEVKPGETVKCEPGEKVIHLSQASLGETKKDKASGNVPVFVKFNDSKLVLGTLSGEKCTQIQHDLVFEKDFELSHSSKSASVFFCGYKVSLPSDDKEPYTDFDSEEEEEEIQLGRGVNGKPEVKEANAAKGAGKVVKPKAKVEETKKADTPKADEDGDSSDEDDSDEDGYFDELLMSNAGDDSDEEDDDDESSDEEEAAPKKAVSGKRGAESILKTPVPEKKAKVTSSPAAGGDGKKSGHTATPHPGKQAVKAPGKDGKSKQQTPKSSGSVTCKSCSKTFNSDNALQAHTKAKHSEAK